MSYILETKEISKSYKNTEVEQQALKNVNMKIEIGEFVAIMGSSGSGKSTLLNILSGLDRPSTGEVLFEGESVSNYNESQLTQLRREKIGFIFQFYHLIPVLNVIENILLPTTLAGTDNKLVEQKAYDLMKLMGLEANWKSHPMQLSGGQQQRVAIARALIHEPSIIMADEPTGSLDSKRSREVMELLEKLNKAYGQSIILVTHDPRVASYASRILFMRDGEIVAEKKLDPDGETRDASVTKINSYMEELFREV